MLTLKIMWDEPRPGSHRLTPPPTEPANCRMDATGVVNPEPATSSTYDAGREFVVTADYPDHYATRARWLSDVIAVEVLDRGIYNSWGQVRQRHGRGVDGYTWLWAGDDEPCGPFGKDDPPRDVALTLILVATRENPDGTVVLVEKAWLLGPDGQTIDRIAP
jgi:hypothetical protein